MKRINLPFEFPNRFGKLMGDLYDLDGNKVPTLAWVGFRREQHYKNNTTALEVISGDSIPTHITMTPGVMAFRLDGSRKPQLLETHTVWFSMS